MALLPKGSAYKDKNVVSSGTDAVEAHEAA
jgi:hypothetical protein